MLETLTAGLQARTRAAAGVRELSDANVDEALADVRASLLEADVDFAVVKDFLARVKERALGERVETRVRDADGPRAAASRRASTSSRVCQEELVSADGTGRPLARARRDGAVSIMLLGLQGVGKTTVAAKLARHLAEAGPEAAAGRGRHPPPGRGAAARSTLGASIDVPVHARRARRGAAAICARAPRARAARGLRRDRLRHRRPPRDRRRADATSSRRSKPRVAPANRLLVCDALMGRDAVNVAKALRRAAHARRPRAHQARRRRARRRRARREGRHRRADQVPRHGRDARPARGVPPRGPRLAHPRHGRRRRPGEGLRAGRRHAAGRGRRRAHARGPASAWTTC